MTETATFTIGGSEAASALGVDPYRSRVQLWLEKTGQLAPTEPGEPARWGTLLEPVIFAELRERGYWVAPDERDTKRNNKYPFMHAHIDGLCWSDNTAAADAVLEIKTAGLRSAHEWADGQAPIAYVIQCHHYMIVTGLDRALLAVLIGGQALEVRELYRDDHLCEFIVKGEQEFARMVAEGEAPPPDGSASTTEALKRLWGHGDPEAVHVFTKEEYGWVEEYRQLKVAARAAETHAEKMGQQIRFTMENATVGLYDGRPVVKWAPVTSSRLDAKALKEAEPELYQSYCRSSTYRRFSA